MGPHRRFAVVPICANLPIFFVSPISWCQYQHVVPRTSRILKRVGALCVIVIFAKPASHNKAVNGSSNSTGNLVVVVVVVVAAVVAVVAVVAVAVVIAVVLLVALVIVVVVIVVVG